jgi:hypothetical protein
VCARACVCVTIVLFFGDLIERECCYLCQTLERVLVFCFFSINNYNYQLLRINSIVFSFNHCLPNPTIVSNNNNPTALLVPRHSLPSSLPCTSSNSSSSSSNIKMGRKAKSKGGVRQDIKRAKRGLTHVSSYGQRSDLTVISAAAFALPKPPTSVVTSTSMPTASLNRNASRLSTSVLSTSSLAIGPYRSVHDILVVGDGDLSFSHALASAIVRCCFDRSLSIGSMAVLRWGCLV